MVLAGLVGGMSVARAQDQPAETTPATAALLHLDAGNRLFRENRYAEAVVEYRAAFVLVPRNKLHFNIGQAEMMGGNFVVAAQELDLFLEDPGDADDNVRVHAETYAARLATLVGTVEVTVSDGSLPGTVVLIDENLTVPMPCPGRPIRLPPGHHTVTVSAPGAFNWSRGIDLSKGDRVALTARLDPTRTTTPPPVVIDAPGTTSIAPPQSAHRAAAAGPPWQRWWFWAAVSGVVGGGVTTALLVRNGGYVPCQGKPNCFRPIPEAPK
jgi:hypothetical protein